MLATISRTTSTQTQMKSQLEKPHNTTRQTEGHNTSHKYAPSYENQVWLSQWPPLLSCCPKPDWENKIPVVLFIRLFVSGGRRRARDRDRVWGSYVTARLPISRHSNTSNEFYRTFICIWNYLLWVGKGWADTAFIYN